MIVTTRRLLYASAAVTATSFVAALYVCFEISRGVREIFKSV